ncbi:unnamed protein product, partial [Polarella glacialis]
AWPGARTEILAAAKGSSAGSDAKKPRLEKCLDPSAAVSFDAAVEAIQRQDWVACGASARAAADVAWQLLARTGGWQSDCDRELFMLAELSSGLAASAAGDTVAAIAHA